MAEDAFGTAFGLRPMGTVGTEGLGDLGGDRRLPRTDHHVQSSGCREAQRLINQFLFARRLAVTRRQLVLPQLRAAGPPSPVQRGRTGRSSFALMSLRMLLSLPRVP